MSADTYGGIWRKVRLYCPLAPPLLVQDWVKNATRQFSDESTWSFLRSESEFLINPTKSGTVILTQNSTTVTSTGGADGLTFVASDVGRQLRISALGPPHTITSVSLVGDTSCVLERAWLGVSSSSQSVIVADLYAVCPEDFGQFIAVIDPQLQRRVRIFTTEAELNAADPARVNTTAPWALVSYRLSKLTATLGRVQYEWWPYWGGTGSLRYPYYYFRRPKDPGEDDVFEGPLRDRGDVILTGALAQAAEWPGSELQKNPYFNLTLAARHRTRYETEMAKLEVRDQEIYLTWLQDQPWSMYSLGFGPVVPVDAAYAQAHE